MTRVDPAHARLSRTRYGQKKRFNVVVDPISGKTHGPPFGATSSQRLRSRWPREVAALPQPSPAAAIDRASGLPLCSAFEWEQASVSWSARPRYPAPRHRGDRPAARLRAPLLFCRPLLVGGRAFPGQEHRNVGSRCQRRGCTNRAPRGLPATPVPPSPIPVARRAGLGEPPPPPAAPPAGTARTLPHLGSAAAAMLVPPSAARSRAPRGGCSGRRGGEGRRSGRGVGSVYDRRLRGGRTSCRHRRRPPC